MRDAESLRIQFPGVAWRAPRTKIVHTPHIAQRQTLRQHYLLRAVVLAVISRSFARKDAAGRSRLTRNCLGLLPQIRVPYVWSNLGSSADRSNEGSL